MRYVIVGNGTAAVMAAEKLTQLTPGAAVDIYGEEPHYCYRRPQLPAFLAGEVEVERMLMHPPAWYDERGIKVHIGIHVEALDPSAQTVRLADGRQIPYDRLLLATGSVPFIPPIQGADQPGVFSLRTVDDALAIREHAARHDRAIVLGGGLLGLEAARGLHSLGLEVVVLESYGWLLPRQLDEPGGQILAQMIEAMGIHVIIGAATKCMAAEECVAGLRLQDGTEVEGDLILISTGVRPRVDLARSAGLEVKRGVVVDDCLRTSDEGIYAAGDVTEHRGLCYGILPAVWDQAPIAAANMAGQEVLYQGTIPTTTLKVVGIDLTSIGEANPEEDGFVELRRADLEAGRYVKVVLREGHLVGAILLGDRRRVRLFSRLISTGADVSPFAERLLDPGFTETPTA